MMLVGARERETVDVLAELALCRGRGDERIVNDNVFGTIATKEGSKREQAKG
jgi:hypothetical protein